MRQAVSKYFDPASRDVRSQCRVLPRGARVTLGDKCLEFQSEGSQLADFALPDQLGGLDQAGEVLRDSRSAPSWIVFNSSTYWELLGNDPHDPLELIDFLVQLAEPLGLDQVPRDGLLADDVLPCLPGLLDDRRLNQDREGEDDGLDVGPSEQVSEVRPRLRVGRVECWRTREGREGRKDERSGQERLRGGRRAGVDGLQDESWRV